MLEHRRILVLAVLVAVAGCDKKSASSGPDKAVPSELQPPKAQFDASKLAAPALFAHIPADTPYIMASFEAVSLDYYGKLKQGLAPTFGKLVAKKRDLSGAQEPDLFDAIFDELHGKLDVQSVEALGLTATPRFAVYGLGLAPIVARLEIRDADTLRATIERVATRAGETLPAPETKGDKSFWRHVSDDATVIIALVDKQLVIGVGPTSEVDKKLDLILGIEKPAQSMADGKALIEVMTKHGYGPQLIGYVDTRELATQAFALAAQEQKQVPASCAPAVDVLAAKVPRVAFGYTEVSGKRASGGAVIELDAAVLAELAALRTEVPGLGSALSDTPLMAMGGGVDLAKGATFLTKAATAMRAVGEACQSEDVVEAASEAIEKLSRPLPPQVAKITGFAGAVHTLEFDKRGLAKLDGFGMVTATSAKELMAQLGGVLPLDQIGLSAGGKLKALAIPAGVLPAEVVGGAGDKAIVVGTGSKGKALAERSLTGTASGKSPFFVATYDYGRFFELQTKIAGIRGDAEDAMEAEMSKDLGAVFGRANFSIDVNDKGLVMWAAMDLK